MTATTQAAASAPAPAISIMMPVYNGGAALAHTLANLLLQTWQDWEAIVLDDGSTDGSRQVIERFAAADPRIRAFHQKNGGRGVARNTVLGHCRGRWIFVWDCDDLASPDTLALAMAQAATADDHTILFVETLLAFSDEQGVHSEMRYPWSPALGNEIAASRRTVPNPGALIPRAAYAAAGQYDPGLRRCQDAHFFWRAAQAGWRFQPYHPALFYRMSSPYYSLRYLQESMHWTRVAQARLHGLPDPAPPALPARLPGLARFYLSRWLATRRFRTSSACPAARDAFAALRTALDRKLAEIP